MSEILEYAASGARRGGPSFSLRNRIQRALWQGVWFLFARWTPAAAWRWRRLLLIWFGAEVGKGAVVRSSALIWLPKNLKLGDHATIGEHVNCYSQAMIEIGPRAVISQGAHLCAGSHDIDHPSFQLIVDPILIGADAWVAAEAFVGPGGQVGEGAVLGARGVLFGSMPAWSVYVGNPARLVRTRKRG